jgi:hypothetical protein
MDKRCTLKTGDVVLFSGNTPTGFLLRTFVSSQWNHSGIAVRFLKIPDPDSGTGYRYEVSLTEEGDLYILETNTGVRKDEIVGQHIIGAGFSEAEWVFQKYNKIAVRRLHDIFRTPKLAALTTEFATKNLGNRFPSSSLPFIGVWLGIPLAEKNTERIEMFCSELMAHYYAYCIGPQYPSLMGGTYDGKLTSLFGTNAPTSEDMFTPGHYAWEHTPNAPIFKGKEELIYTQSADLWYIILQPFLIIAMVALLIWMSLPH